MNKKLPRIAVLALGGTLCSLGNSRVDEFYSSAKIPIDALINDLPELKNIAQIQYEQIAQISSHNLTEALWIRLAKKINSMINHFDGIVITQGTHSIEETAYFLHLTINTEKPIILTGALRTANALGSDGLRNLFNAVLLATHPASHNQGVLLTFNDEIYSAREACKTLSGFAEHPLKIGVLGYIQGSTPYFYAQSIRKHTSSSEFASLSLKKLPNVQIVYGHVGHNEKLIDFLVKQKTQGIISVGMGKGYQQQKTTAALGKARKKGVAVVRCARNSGLITTREPDFDAKYNFIAGDNLSPQKARILLALGLCLTQQTEKLQNYFNHY